MAEEYVVERRAQSMLLGGVALAILLGAGALVWCYGLQNHVTVAEQKQAAAEQQNAALKEQIATTNARLRATSETLGQSVGMTQKQIEARTAQIVATQRIAEAKIEATSAANAANARQIGAVSSDVATVKTDVGGVKSEVATTKSDLESTKSQMRSMMGDEGKMSGLIATNHDELEVLKHKGDRNYYEFSLQKGKPATLVSTIKLQLKKVDEKKSRYTLNVSSDDRNIEKKDKSLDEPVQFYSGKTPMLFEIVVNRVAKNVVSGYLSTPKNAPQPIALP